MTAPPTVALPKVPGLHWAQMPPPLPYVPTGHTAHFEEAVGRPQPASQSPYERRRGPPSTSAGRETGGSSATFCGSPQLLISRPWSMYPPTSTITSSSTTITDGRVGGGGGARGAGGGGGARGAPGSRGGGGGGGGGAAAQSSAQPSGSTPPCESRPAWQQHSYGAGASPGILSAPGSASSSGHAHEIREMRPRLRRAHVTAAAPPSVPGAGLHIRSNESISTTTTAPSVGSTARPRGSK